MDIRYSLLLLLAFVPGLSAQIATDRPDFVESSATVGAGTVQIETSAAHERDGTLRVWSTPTLLRVGVGPRFELRAESDLLMRESVGGGNSEVGVADLSLGVKLSTTEGGGRRPATALLVHADLPSGSAPWRGEGVRPSLRVVGEWELPKDMSLGVMPGVARADGPLGVHTSGLLGIVVGKSLTERARTFLELTLEHIASDEDGGVVGSWDAGVALLVGNSAQLDAMISLAATSRAPSAAFTVGYSRIFTP